MPLNPFPIMKTKKHVLLFFLLAFFINATGWCGDIHPWSIKKGVEHNGLVYLLNEVEQLEVLDLQGRKLSAFNGIPNARIVDVALVGGKLTILAIDAMSFGQGKIYQQEKNEWKSLRRFSIQMKEIPYAITEIKGNLAVISNQRILVANKEGKWDRIVLAEALLRSFDAPKITVINDALFWGVNMGELGGTLQRVNLTDGVTGRPKTSKVFDPARDSVTGVASSPLVAGESLIAIINREQSGLFTLLKAKLEKLGLQQQKLKNKFISGDILDMQGKEGIAWVLTEKSVVEITKKNVVSHEIKTWQKAGQLTYSTDIPGVIVLQRLHDGKSDRTGTSHILVIKN